MGSHKKDSAKPCKGTLSAVIQSSKDTALVASSSVNSTAAQGSPQACVNSGSYGSILLIFLHLEGVGLSGLDPGIGGGGGGGGC